MASPLSFKNALVTLVRHEVAFVIVGGVAAVLSGVPISTFDLDIVHERSQDNVAKLLAALGEMDARYRDPAGRVIRPEAAPLSGDGHHLLITRFGPLDALGKLSTGHRYEELATESTSLNLEALRVLVLDLPAQIRIKAALGRDKDRAVLAILRRTLDESKP